MEDNLDIVLDKMRTASSEEKLKKYLKDALSSLDDFRAKYEFYSANFESKAYLNVGCTT